MARTIDLGKVVGEQGPQGATGPQGPQGPQGATGPQGEKGEKGDTGSVQWGQLTPEQIAQLKGDKGDTGAQGPQGVQGPKGDKGDTGAQGPQGVQGQKGEQGDPASTDDCVKLSGNQSISGTKTFVSKIAGEGVSAAIIIAAGSGKYVDVALPQSGEKVDFGGGVNTAPFSGIFFVRMKGGEAGQYIQTFSARNSTNRDREIRFLGKANSTVVSKLCVGKGDEISVDYTMSGEVSTCRLIKFNAEA